MIWLPITILDVAYPVELPRILSEFPEIVEAKEEAAVEEVAEDLVRIYKEEITAVGAIDTRYFIDTVHIRARRRLERDVASDALYSAVVEHGWIYRARGQASYPGRWPAGRAIVQLGDSVQQAFARQLAR